MSRARLRDSCNLTSARRRFRRAGRELAGGRRSCRSRVWRYPLERVERRASLSDCEAPSLRRAGVRRPKLLRTILSWSYLDSRGTQRPLELGDGNRARVEDACSESGVGACFLEHRGEMRHRAGPSGGHERHTADRADRPQLLDVIAAAHTIAAHAVEHDLARAALLRLAHPGEHVPARLAGALRVAGELVGAVTLARELAVDADDDALRAEA